MAKKKKIASFCSEFDPDDMSFFHRRLTSEVKWLLASSEELRLYFHPHSETVINIRSVLRRHSLQGMGRGTDRTQSHVNTHTHDMWSRRTKLRIELHHIEQMI